MTFWLLTNSFLFLSDSKKRPYTDSVTHLQQEAHPHGKRVDSLFDSAGLARFV